jgi:ribosomal protein L6P/L9E
MRRKHPRTPGITFESLESRIALSVSNDTSPLDALSDLVPPLAVTFHTKAAAAAPAVVSNSASLARTAERITITGTGFSAKPAHNTVIFSGSVTGKVVSATSTQLVVQFTQKPVGVGTLSAVVTTKGRSSGAPVVVAMVVKPPRVTANTASLSRSAATLTIQGSGFDPSNLTNRVSIVGNATGRVIAATATTLTVAVDNLPPAGTTLKAVVKSFGGKSGIPVAVATIVRKATVTPSTQPIKRSDTTLQIAGTGFDTVAANNKVTFNRGAQGYVTSATRQLLVVQLTTPPTAGRLKASVTAFGGSSGAAVQVATVTQSPTVTTSSAYLAGNATTLVINGSGFSTTASANTVAFNLGAVGTVTAATSTQLTVTFSTAPTSLGNLMAVVTTNSVTSGAAVQVATVVKPLTVTPRSASVAIDAPTLVITGNGFNPTSPSANAVAFNLGAVGTVTAATSTSLTVSLTTPPASLGALTAVVTANGATSGAAVQVSTIVAAPSVTETSSTNLAVNAPTLVITGTGFNATFPAANRVAFNLGAVGTVTAATSTSLTVSFTTPPTSLSTLTAVVTSYGGSSGAAVTVADIVAAPVVTASSASFWVDTPTLVITGSNFNTTSASANTVTLSLGAVGTVTAVTSTSLTVSLTTPPTLPGNLTAIVTANGGTSGAAVQVATVVDGPLLTASSTNLAVNAPTLVINGYGFSTTPSENIVVLSSGAGVVTAATATQLTVTLVDQPAFGTLTAEVLSSNGGDIYISSGTSAQVATVIAAPTVTIGQANQASSVTSVTINGTGFNAATPSANTVVLSLGAVGTVTAATSTQLTVSFSTQPTSLGGLTAVVTSNGGSSGTSVQVATVVAVPTVTQTTTDVFYAYSSYMTIEGTGFDTFTPSNNTVAFNLGAVGTVTAATPNYLTIKFSTLPTSTGTLTAIVTTDGGSSGTAVQVATVKEAEAYDIDGEEFVFFLYTSTAPQSSELTIYGYFTPDVFTYFCDYGSVTAAESDYLTIDCSDFPSVGSTIEVLVTQYPPDYLPSVPITWSATVATAAPSVSSSTTSLSATTMTIYGTGFDTTAANNTVAFNMGAVGFVDSASSTQLDIVFETLPTTSGPLLAVVTTDGVSVGAVQVATFYATPVVTASTSSLPFNATTVTIYGDGFDTDTINNTVTFSNTGVTGVVTTATPNSLTVTFDPSSTQVLGPLNAVVTSNGYSSGTAVQVATVVPAVTQNTATIATTTPTLTITGAGFDTTAANNVVSLTLGGQTLTATVTSATSTSLTVTLPTFDAITTQSMLTAVVTTDGYSSSSTQVATVVPPPTLYAASTGLFLANGATLTMAGVFYDTDYSDYTVTFSNGAVGYVTGVTSSTLTVAFTTLPTTLGPMSATVTDSASYGTTSATQSQVAIVFPSLTYSGLTYSTVNSNETNVIFNPYDQNDQLMNTSSTSTGGAASIASYCSYNATYDVPTDGSIGGYSYTANDNAGQWQTTDSAPAYEIFNTWNANENTLNPGGADGNRGTFYFTVSIYSNGQWNQYPQASQNWPF